MDEHCRITVIGGRRQVDLAVPAAAPILTYIDYLVQTCALPESEVMPAAWSLALPTREPFAPERSLAELGIADGQVLYLRDVIEDEYADPIVHDVVERVGEVAEHLTDRRWGAGPLAVTVLLVGLGWLVATLGVLAARHQIDYRILGDIALTVAFGFPALAWVATERRWTIPAPLLAILGLSAIPFAGLGALALSAAGWPGMPAGAPVEFLLLGVVAGAALAYLTVPGIATSTALLTALLVTVPGAALVAIPANRVESAGLAALLAFTCLTIAPATVSQLVVHSYRRAAARGVPPDHTAVDVAVRQATTLLIVWTWLLAAVLGGALILLADAVSAYPAAAAGLIGIALLLRAGAAQLVAEVVPVAVAGAIGLLGLTLVLPGRLGLPGAVGATLATCVAMVLLAYGFRRLMRSERPARPRPEWLTGAASTLVGVSVALVAASFGLYGWLVGLGHHL